MASRATAVLLLLLLVAPSAPASGAEIRVKVDVSALVCVERGVDQPTVGEPLARAVAPLCLCVGCAE